MMRRIAKRARQRAARYDRAFTKAKELARSAREPRHFIHRLQIGSELAREAPFVIPKHAGFARFEPTTFADTAALVATGREIHARVQREARQTPKADKQYFRNIMTEDDLASYPEILRFALDRKLLGSLSAYFGFVPELCSVGLMISQPSEARVGSQHGHFDSRDSHHVKVIVAVEDVAPENGPFEFLPAARSRALRSKHGLGLGFGGRFDDDALFAMYRRDQFVQMTARAGEGMVVDTSNCLHFGSRVERGFRLLWFVHFATFADYQRMAATGNGAILMMHQANRSSLATDAATRLALGVR
jgi:hypothetical protein